MKDIPNSDIAFDLVTKRLGLTPIDVRRFTTGGTHYVFEALFEAHASVVVRIAMKENHAAMTGARNLSNLLRPLGVPLPEILAEGLDDTFPYLILERLPGVDLNDVINNLSDTQLAAIAAEVAKAQLIVSKLPTSSRYGYAPAAADAPHAEWHQVLMDNLKRSQKRITAAGVFNTEPVDKMMALVEAAKIQLNSIPATPFMHDTTTKNVIINAEGKFSGIVDVDNFCFGDPRYVVALTLAAILAFGGSVGYIDAWMNAGNYQDDV
jgi:aminoglycoside phosphotransferase (APT) family kinase protein